MKRLIWSLKDPSQGDLPSYGRPVKLLRRILGLKDPLADRSGAPPQPSIVERLDNFFAHDRTDFWDSFEKYERPTGLLSDGYSSVEELRARLARQSTTRLTARDGGPRRKLIFACLSVSLLVLILGAAMIFFRRDPARKAEPGVSSSQTAAQVSAPSEAEPHPEATPDSGTSETQLPRINPDSQPSVQSQPSTSTASGLQKEIKEPADQVSGRLPRAVGKLTPHATTPPKVALLREEPLSPVLMGEVPGAVPGGQAGSALSGIVSEPSRTGLTPAPQIQSPAGTPGGTANRSRSLETDSGRTIGEGSGSVGASGTSEGSYGVKITQITADGPAAQAGLRVGDIVTELDGIPVKMAQILDAEIALRKPGSKIRISYLRNSTQGEVTVTVGKRVMP